MRSSSSRRMDPAYVSVADYVKTTQAGNILRADRITPLQLADLLERDCREAMRPGDGTSTPPATPRCVYEVADVQAWALPRHAPGEEAARRGRAGDLSR